MLINSLEKGGNETMKKKVIASILAAMMVLGMMGCSSGNKDQADAQKESQDVADGEEKGEENSGEETEIQVFIAASLNTVMTDLAEKYAEDHPGVKITYNADSSGTLLTQIQEGYECDLFFSAAKKQMDTLEEDGLMVEGTRSDIVNNVLVVVSRKDSGTEVTGLEDLDKAESIALAGGSVPAGRYTRQALVNLGTLPASDDPASITTTEVSDALGGVEISEQDNVSKVLLAVAEGSCEVGTTYYSDIYGYEDELEVLQKVDSSLTGQVIYPAALVVNKEADEAQTKAAEEFLAYLQSEEAAEVFEAYYFEPMNGSK